MKKILLSTFLLGLSNLAFSQLPNGDFENWNTTSYQEPNGWYTSNREVMPRIGLATVTRVSGSSGYAVRMETVISGQDTAFTYIDNTEGDPTQGEGGLPYTQRPTGLTGSYRYNLPGNDTAWIFVAFKKNGSVIFSQFFPVRGTGSQPVFTNFNIPFTIPSVPDTFILAAIPSNLINEVGIQNGSFLELDNLAFSGATQPIPEGDFENWTTVSSDELVGWDVFGDQGLSKTTDSYSGNYALRLETIDYGGGNIAPAGINTRQPYTMIFDTLSGTFVDTLIGFYKFSTPGSGQGRAIVDLYANGTLVGNNSYFFNPAAPYTEFRLPITTWFPVAPDTIWIDFESSDYPWDAGDIGSVLIIDHLALKSMLTTIPVVPSSAFSTVTAYPNPATETLYLRFSKPEKDVTVRVLDMTGIVVSEQVFSGNVECVSINIEALNTGTYFYEARRGGKYSRSTFVVK